ncbi:MAG: NADH-quinone oxidoreductase subunit C [Candidatus Omnitrophica bacterium]|nr:NADH-quinone oxidoreductase subunit C [Candidatus Omnitrophota bacterium]
MIKEEVRKRLGNKIKDWHKHGLRRVYFSFEPRDVKEIVAILFKELGMRFATASGQDTPAGLEIIYHFSFDKTGEMFSGRVLIKDKARPEIDSIANLFPGAEWIEREMWEMLGINFKGHPNLKRLLLAEDWPEGKHPLRKG